MVKAEQKGLETVWTVIEKIKEPKERDSLLKEKKFKVFDGIKNRNLSNTLGCQRKDGCNGISSRGGHTEEEKETLSTTTPTSSSGVILPRTSKPI